MGPSTTVPTNTRLPDLAGGRSVVLVVDQQQSTPPEVFSRVIGQEPGRRLDPLWPGGVPPEVISVRDRDHAVDVWDRELVAAVILIPPSDDRQLRERTLDLHHLSARAPLIVVHDGPAEVKADLVEWGADDAVERGLLDVELVPSLMTELHRRRRIALEQTVSAHVLIDVLSFDSGYVVLDMSGRVVESALRSGEPWFGGLTGLSGVDLIAPGDDARRFASALRQAQSVPSVVRTVEVEVVSSTPDRRWLEISLVNLGSVSALEGVVAMHRDVTPGHRLSAPNGRGGADESVLDCLAEGVVAFAPDGTITHWNESAARLLGTPVADAVGADINALVPHVVPPGPEPPDSWSDEVLVVQSDGEQVLERHFTRMWDPGRKLRETVLVVSSAIDEHAASAIARRFAAILDSSSEAILSTASDGDITTWNVAAARMYGYRAEEAVGRHVSMLVPEERRPELATILRRVAAGSVVEHLETVRRGKDGTEAMVVLSLSPLFDAGGAAVGSITVARDVVEQRVAEADRVLAETLFAGTFWRSTFGMGMADLVGRLTHVNPTLCELLGRPARDLIGHQLTDFAHVEEASPDGDGIPVLREGTDSYTDERRYCRPDGTVIWLQANVTLSRGPQAEALYLMLQVLDITSRKRVELELEHRALHDDLTGLPNRALLNDRLEQALAVARRTGGGVGVAFLDVDGFKNVNDVLGHRAGDSLLVGLGQRLSAAVRPEDTVARFGGDEFVILCTDVTIEEMSGLAERIGSTMVDRFDVGGHEVEVHASLGITVSAAQSSVQSMLSEADAAMFRAKELGRNRVAVFDDTIRARAADFLDGERALRLAIARQDLVAFYQPVMDLATDRPIGVEALVRWVREDGRVVLPGEFIPLAEESGLIVRLGELMLLEAAQTVSAWNAGVSGDGGLWVAVNLSARQFAEPTLVDAVRHALAATGLAPDKLHLEMTETVVMHDVEESIVRLDQIRALGVHVSVDDFGTGYSSLAYLKQLPVDTLKIDRRFIDGVASDPDDRSIVEAVISLGQALGLMCLAEGVESDEQLEALVQLGCESGQGYLWAHAMAEGDARRWLSMRGCPRDGPEPRGTDA